ncbi:sugar phosphate isomerase/epimerase family protein [Pseudomonas sp. BJa3]|uniref:sugar phosphate isomerase/epimerase family protein n=1 Tax=Pseudomonas sp. BJa3 TaxID=2986525 RepID=UPI0022658CBA|nr:sugar phosphate isomerase/epimerase family protein [Pseudomonas sp. BJa3]MCX5510528.1 sugar phosphate isomerase/epimerase [Pseudomonas sp. BJa3]
MNDYLRQYADAGLYTMQGRLGAPEQGRFQSFPREGWQLEIERASRIGLRGIEWIYDVFGEGANPLETEAGRKLMGDLLAQHQVSVVSICADYFMDRPLLRCSVIERGELLERLKWLLDVSAQMGVGRVVLPFVDASRIRDDAERDQVVESLTHVLPVAEQHGVELHLETDLAPLAFAGLLERLDHPLVKVNYDAGNSASLGYRPEEEFEAYGPRIGSFHIKDRRLGAGTVPLGEGDTDFHALREQLIKHEYRGDFVLQVARGEAGDEPRWLSGMAALATDWLRGEALNERTTS